MHATWESRRGRARRTLLAFAVTSMLAASAFAGSVTAATPNWSMDPIVLLPSAVTPGDAAGYGVTINNAGPSNISQLYLVAYLGGTDLAAPAPVFTSTTQGSCPNTNDTLYCSLGPLRAGASVSVTVAFMTPAEGTEFSIRFEANTTGATPSDGGTSHGDTIERTATTTLSDDPDFAGRFVLSGTQTVSNLLLLGPGNLQSTTVHSPTTGIPVTVADGDQAGTLVCTPACWSETSEIHVDGGADNGLFKVEIGIDKDLSETVHGVYHEFDPGHVPASETITDKCPKHGSPSAPCFSVTNLGGGDILVTVWLAENGKIGNF
jgi:hypothetical protein